MVKDTHIKSTKMAVPMNSNKDCCKRCIHILILITICAGVAGAYYQMGPNAGFQQQPDIGYQGPNWPIPVPAQAGPQQPWFQPIPNNDMRNQHYEDSKSNYNNGNGNTVPANNNPAPADSKDTDKELQEILMGLQDPLKRTSLLNLLRSALDNPQGNTNGQFQNGGYPQPPNSFYGPQNMFPNGPPQPNMGGQFQPGGPPIQGQMYGPGPPSGFQQVPQYSGQYQGPPLNQYWGQQPMWNSWNNPGNQNGYNPWPPQAGANSTGPSGYQQANGQYNNPQVPQSWWNQPNYQNSGPNMQYPNRNQPNYQNYWNGPQQANGPGANVGLPANPWANTGYDYVNGKGYDNQQWLPQNQQSGPNQIQPNSFEDIVQPPWSIQNGIILTALMTTKYTSTTSMATTDPIPPTTSLTSTTTILPTTTPQTTSALETTTTLPTTTTTTTTAVPSTQASAPKPIAATVPLVDQWLAAANAALQRAQEEKQLAPAPPAVVPSSFQMPWLRNNPSQSNAQTFNFNVDDDYAKAAEDYMRSQAWQQPAPKMDFDPNYDYAKAAQDFALGNRQPTGDNKPTVFDPNYDYAKAAQDFALGNINQPSPSQNIEIISPDDEKDDFQLEKEIIVPNTNDTDNKEFFQVFVEPADQGSIEVSGTSELPRTPQTLADKLQILNISPDTIKAVQSKMMAFKQYAMTSNDITSMLEEIKFSQVVDGQQYANTNDTFYMPSLPFLGNYQNPCWYESNPKGQLHCLPSFFVAGLDGCDTGEVLETLLLHPQVVLPSNIQPDWWSTQRLTKSNISSGYINLFNDAAAIIQQHSQNNQHNLVTLDANADTLLPFGLWKVQKTLYSKTDVNVHTPQQIAKLLPQAKFIVTLCNPTNRLYTLYQEMNLGNAHDFSNYVSQAMSVVYTCIGANHANQEVCLNAQPTNNGYDTFVEKMQAGLYDQFLSEWLQTWSKDQFFFIKMEDFKTSKVAYIQRLLEFLKLSPINPDQIKASPPSDVSHSIPMAADAKRNLDIFYSKSNQNLQTLLGDRNFYY